MQTKEQIIARMDAAAREGREQFFKVADTLHLQPKYNEHAEELATLKQEWRDMTTQENYPEIDFPLALPEWFPEVKIFSNWKASYADDIIARQEAQEARKAEALAEAEARRAAEAEDTADADDADAAESTEDSESSTEEVTETAD